MSIYQQINNLKKKITKFIENQAINILYLQKYGIQDLFDINIVMCLFSSVYLHFRAKLVILCDKNLSSESINY